MLAAATHPDTVFRPLADAEAVCLVIPDFLSRQECAALIAEQEERGYASAAGDYPPSYRNNERQVRDDPALAARLLPRLRVYAPSAWEEVSSGGVWRLDAINERFRCCRYRAGQRFGLHQDGVHYRGDTVRSCYTFMIYLDDGAAFDGGDTVFYSAGPGGDAAGRPAREIGRVRPRAGSLILFGHALWHAGEEVRSGVKHILRSDVLYRRSAPSPQLSQPFQPGHRGYVWTLAGLGGGRLASAGRDTVIRVWDEAGCARGQLRGHRQSVLGLAALGRDRLASVSRDRSLRLWDVASGQCLREVPAHAAAVLGVCRVGADNLATCGADGLIKLWDQAGNGLGELRGHSGWVWELAAAGEYLASASEDGSVKVWLPSRGLCLATLPGDVPLRTVAWASAEQLLCGDIAGRVAIWRLSGTGWRLERRFQAHAAAVRRLRLLDGGCDATPECKPLVSGELRYASCGEDGRVCVWRWSDGALLQMARHANFATDVLPLADGWLSSGYDGCLRRHAALALPMASG